jgi:hypothetical protein
MKQKQHSTEEIIRILRRVDLLRAQYLQSHLPPLETQIRRHRYRRCQTAQRVGKRKRGAEENAGRSHTEKRRAGKSV